MKRSRDEAFAPDVNHDASDQDIPTFQDQPSELLLLTHPEFWQGTASSSSSVHLQSLSRSSCAQPCTLQQHQAVNDHALLTYRYILHWPAPACWKRSLQAGIYPFQLLVRHELVASPAEAQNRRTRYTSCTCISRLMSSGQLKHWHADRHAACPDRIYAESERSESRGC